MLRARALRLLDGAGAVCALRRLSVRGASRPPPLRPVYDNLRSVREFLRETFMTPTWSDAARFELAINLNSVKVIGNRHSTILLARAGYVSD